ncbi:MAG: hypothetical protein RL682_272, partial [Pseudomonadota bacterium]
MDLEVTAFGPVAAPLPARPTVRFMASHPAHWIALGFGSGLSRIAPGTSGTLWAWVGQVMAFGLFRFFDAVKPGPVGWADALFHHTNPQTDRFAWHKAGFG